MRVLVTGATGFLGSHIARGLVAAGHDVRILTRPAASHLLVADLPVEVAIGDILDPPSLDAAARDMQAVIHAAANMRGSGGLHTRVQSHLLGTRHMLAAARRAGVRRFVYVSSVAALGVPDAPLSPTDAAARRMDETHTWNAPPDLWPYGYAKHLSEQEVAGGAGPDLEAVIVNPSIVLGAGDVHRVSNAVVWYMLRGRTLPVIPGGVGVVHVEDVAEGVRGALERGLPGERYILNGENLRVEDLLATVAVVTGRPSPRLRIPFGLARALADAVDGAARIVAPGARPILLQLAGRYFYFDNQKAVRELGVSLSRTARDGAQQAADWYRHKLAASLKLAGS